MNQRDGAYAADWDGTGSSQILGGGDGIDPNVLAPSGDETYHWDPGPLCAGEYPLATQPWSEPAVQYALDPQTSTGPSYQPYSPDYSLVQDHAPDLNLSQLQSFGSTFQHHQYLQSHQAAAVHDEAA